MREAFVVIPCAMNEYIEIITSQLLPKCRLREYEVAVDKYTNRGPEMERISFVILEMSRKSVDISVESELFMF